MPAEERLYVRHAPPVRKYLKKTSQDVCVLRVRVVRGEIVELEAVDEPRGLSHSIVQK
jgi:hypothetical protein